MDKPKYIYGLGRANEDYEMHDETHIYYQFSNGELVPLCIRGYNRDGGTGISIFRGNIGRNGVCPVCEGRKSKSFVPKHKNRLPRKLKKAISNFPRYTPLLPHLPLTVPHFPLTQEQDW